MKRLSVLVSLLAAFASAAGAATLIAPSGSSIPENLLRISVQFDAPLGGQLDMRHVTLVDASGQTIENALLDIPLTSRDRKRVSILLHPGRIKTGVGPNLAVGPALHEGATVVLLIDDPQLPQPLKKSWVVGPTLSQNIDVHAWRIQAPQAGTRKPLQLAFSTALDAGSVQMIAVASPTGGRVNGKAILIDGETGWQFTPSAPWRAGTYRIRVHPDLEDPQGNRMCSAFEQIQQSGKACDDEGILSFSIR
jgi:hypothetical protein